ncbi:FAD dependent oxidoreductase [Thozetella sp. PMI_491]|nr:FAD dependent oxidoreductase [Thozetella sp. PMI_491]
MAPAASSSSFAPSSASFSPPSSVLVIGSGVFGLGTAWALARRDGFSSTSITVVDRSDLSSSGTAFPARDASSIDSSRIIRPDYADPAYAALAAEAQVQWRKQDSPDDLGAEGRYSESGFVLVADASPLDGCGISKKTGMDYVRYSYQNVMALAAKYPDLVGRIRELPDVTAVRDATGTGGLAGSAGYINERSGWANAENSMAWLYHQVKRTGRVTFVSGTVESLEHDSDTITGVKLRDGRVLSADLVVLAAGAWTGSLIDLSGQATATGQVVGYMDLTESEQQRLHDIPVVLNLSTGLFVIPPRDRVLKLARHAFGYVNPTTLSQTPLAHPQTKPGPTPVSRPYTHLDDPSLSIPPEGLADLRRALHTMVPLPSLVNRPFSSTRLCWYTDTPTGDFIITYHPSWRNLFVATGGSGHGFKFLPVLGDKIVDCIEGRCPPEFRDKWAWKPTYGVIPEVIVTEDGSRGGKPGLVLAAQWSRPSL